MDRYKRLVALAVTIVMLVAVMPMSTFAEETPPQGDLPETFISENEPATGAGVVDFSENNMLAAAFHPSSDFGYVGDPNSGGFPSYATAYYARWGGPVLESDDPYPSPATADNMQYYASQPRAAMVTDALVVPNDIGTAATNISRIKQMVYEQGAVYIVMQYDANGYMNWDTRAFYMPPNAVQQGSYGHAVTVVGWDNTYSRTNFKSGIRPSSDGAFIIKNSHGTGGSLDDGYFYLSYQDKCVGKLFKVTQSESFNYTSDNVVYLANDASLYDNNYGYDPYGYTNSYGWDENPANTVYMANVFTATSAQTLRAVSFYTNEYNVSYEVYIKTATTATGTLPETTTLTTAMRKASGTQAYPGYHTVSLNSPLALTSGQKFSVIIKITGSVSYPFCLEVFTGDELHITQTLQQSFVSAGGGWFDINAGEEPWNANLCIRAFTTNGISTGGAPTGGLQENEEKQPNDTDEDNSDELSASAELTEEQQEEQDTPEEDEPATGVQPLLEVVSYLDTLDLHEGDEPPTGSADENDFIAGTKLQRYSLYFDRGGEPPTSGTLPAKYDLRDTGIITPVKDQGAIGSCWTFAATASAESTYLRRFNVDDFSINLTRTAPYLRQGSSMTIGVTATDESLVEGYAWSFSGGGFGAFQGEGNRSVTFSAAPGAMENIINGSCTATLTSGIEVKKDFTIALTDYGATADGSAANPYQVNTAKKLELINGFLGEDFKEVHFVQTADIDLEGNAWTPIGYYRSETDKLPFMGSYDGGGYVISRLIPDITDASYSKAIGLFGYTKDAQIRNVTINNYDRRTEYTFDTNDYSTPFWFGGFAGYTENTALTDCTTAVALRVPNSINVTAGGLVGKMKGGSMDHCATTYTDLYYSSIAPGQNITMGGLIGETDGASVTKCYSDLLVDYHAVSNLRIGGLIGLAANGTQVSDSFVIGYVAETVVNSTPVRTTAGLAFIGTGSKSTFTRCYAYTPFVLNDRYGGSTGYTLFGGNTGASGLSQSYCFYNKDVVGSASKMGTDKTTVQMGTQSAFSGFDFTNNWTMIQGNQHWSGISSFPAMKNPLGALMGDYGLYPTAIFSGETVQINGTQNPYHVWLQQVGAETTHPEIVLVSNGGGVLTGGKYGVTSVMLVAGGAGGTVLKTIDNFTVITRPGDLNFTGTPQYPQAIALLLDLLTGKLADYEHYYVLNADRTDDKVFDVTRDDISLSDLVTMKQRAVGAYVRPL